MGIGRTSLTVSEKDKMIKAEELRISTAQEKLDLFNHTSLIEISDEIKELST